MKILIIPDIHEEFELAQKILDRYEKNVDMTIFLGDYFDSWNYDDRHIEHFREHLRWLKRTFFDDTSFKRKWLIGNHDVQYFTENSNYVCSGFFPWKIIEVDSILGRSFWKNWDFLYFIKGARNYLFSHAGLHSSLISPMTDLSSAAFYENLNTQMKYNFNLNIGDRMLQAGRSRGGFYNIGGITWLDFTHEFEDIDGLVQIVGHTKKYSIRHKGQSTCLDTGLDHIMILNTETNEQKIIEVEQ